MYGHFTVAELEALRDKLQASLTARLTAPTEAAGANRSVKYAIRVQDIRRELELVMAELARRSGTVARGPIYLAG
jgi:hypothetical protein